MARLLALLSLAGLLIGLAAYHVEALGPAPHDSPCGNCHLAGESVTADNAHQLLGTQERLCGDCHADALRLSHASGFNPGRPLPAAYPVDWKGDVTCSTCHDVHNDRPGLLRGEARGREFCLACHGEGFFLAMVDGGRSLTESGHLAARRDEFGFDLDPATLRCLDCHSDKADAGPAVDFAPGGVLRHADHGINHPIGVPYARAISYGGYRPVAQLSPDIQLPQGRIGCISCHRGYTREHGALVIANRGSRLCFECHDI